MTKNLLLIALRVVFKQKANTLIKAGGLAVGFSCCVLIILYVHLEYSYDSFHRKGENIFRIVEDVTLPAGKTETASARGPVGPTLLREFPEVKGFTRLNGASMLMKYKENHFQEDKVYFADSTVFELFTFPFLKGDPQSALTKSNSIVLTRTSALRYFGDEDPLGKEMIIDNEVPFTVTGVMEDVPSNSHLRFDMLLSMSTRGSQWLNTWGWGAYTYVETQQGVTPELLHEKLGQFAAVHRTEMLSGGETERTLSAQPLKEIHLYSKRSGEPGVPGNPSDLMLFLVVAALVLLIAGVNFVNLTTAQAVNRAREVGVRKVIGGTRTQLASQFLMESVILSLVAAGISFCIVSMVTTELLFNPLATIIFFLAAIFIGGLAGWYPALVLSSFRPVSVLKGTFKTSRSGFLREGLIVVQFSISIALIIGTIAVFTQLDFMRNKDLGYDKEQVLVIYFGDDEGVQGKTETIKQELLRSTNLLGAATSSNVPGREPGTTRAEMTSINGDMTNADVALIAVDHDFIPFYKLSVVGGRPFTSTIPTDAEGLMVNESALHQLGFETPEDILDREMTVRGVKGKVIGVVKDFHYASLHKAIGPMVMRMRAQSLSYFSLKIDAGATSILPALEEQWSTLAPTRPFDYFFLDDQFDKQYKSDQQFGQLFGSAAAISIVLACLGLFGLVSFIVEQRTKEISIRKVLGASIAGVVALLSMNFMKLIGLSIIIATVVSWYAMDLWLQGFPYRINMQWWMFLLAGGTGLVVALITISLKSVKAATANPVESLRRE